MLPEKLDGPFTLPLADAAATEALGVRLAAHAEAPFALLLSGPLGAGKTTLARAFIRALMRDPELDVPSPTYTLVQGYDTPHGPLAHFDLYRIEEPGELEEIGWGDALSGIVLVEWPERLGDGRLAQKPARGLAVTLAPQGEARLANLMPLGWQA